MIERIEVITNPSSRYDAAGETGIINIILKKNKTKGFNGNFTGTAGYPANFSGAYSINYRTQKMNLFSSFGTNYRKKEAKVFPLNVLAVPIQVLCIIKQINVHARIFPSNFMAGMDYYIITSTTFTGSFLIEGGREKNLKRFYMKILIVVSLTKSILRTDNETANERDTEVSLSFTKKISWR